MHRKLILILILTIKASAYCQIGSSCNVPDELRKAYDLDVFYLANERVLQTNSPYKDSLWSSQAIEDSIWNGLAAIYNAYSLPDRDSIFDIYCVHKQSCLYPYLSIIIDVDTNYSWTHSWDDNTTIKTGYNDLDEFLSRFSFELIFYTYYDLDSIGVAMLQTKEHINMPVFMKLYADTLQNFDGIDTVHYVQMTSCCHNYIEYSNTTGIDNYEFYYGWDGMLGCDNYIKWKFEVDNCNVEMTDKSFNISDPMGVISNCQITSGLQWFEMKGSFTIAPNPVKNILLVSTDLPNKFNISIYDLLGTRIFTNDFIQELEISLEDFNSGLYILKVYDETSRSSYNYKLIKK